MESQKLNQKKRRKNYEYTLLANVQNVVNRRMMELRYTITILWEKVYFASNAVILMRKNNSQNESEMNDILFKKIKRANRKYAEYLSACDKIAKEAQKHISWNDSVGCAYMPGDGLCIEIEAHVCPVTIFFELPEIIGDDMIDEYTYRTNCI